MFRIKDQPRESDQKRRVVISIKTSGYKPEEGHRITEIACVEMRGMEKTGNNFHAFVNPGEDLMRLCRDEYNSSDKLTPRKTKAAAYTISAMEHAPTFTVDDARFIRSKGVPAYLCESIAAAQPFEKVQNALMRYLRTDPETVIVTHDMGRLKTFFENQMTKKNWETFLKKYHDPKHGMMQKVHKFRAPGLFPEPVGKSWASGLSLDAICKYFDVDTSRRTYYSAMQDALLLSDVVMNRKELKMDNINYFPNSKSYPVVSGDDAEEDSTDSLRISR